MKTIIAGSRTIDDPTIVDVAVEQAAHLITVSEVVSGAAQGVDRLGEIWAVNNNIPYTDFPADWAKHGKAAGPIRNQEMVDYADALIAVWDGESRGTADVIKRAERKGLKVYIHRI